MGGSLPPEIEPGLKGGPMRRIMSFQQAGLVLMLCCSGLIGCAGGQLRISGGVPLHRVFIADVRFDESIGRTFGLSQSSANRREDVEQFNAFAASVESAIHRELSTRGYEVVESVGNGYRTVSFCSPDMLQNNVERWARAERPRYLPDDAAVLTVVFCVETHEPESTWFSPWSELYAVALLDEWRNGSDPRPLWNSAGWPFSQSLDTCGRIGGQGPPLLRLPPRGSLPEPPELTRLRNAEAAANQRSAEEARHAFETCVLRLIPVVLRELPVAVPASRM
jgi:hypothetical protein